MKKLFLVILLIGSCGEPSDDYEKETRTPVDSGKFKAVKQLIADNCGKCHNGSVQKAFDSEARWNSSNAKARITNGSMPTDKKLSDSDKNTLLASFN